VNEVNRAPQGRITYHCCQSISLLMEIFYEI